MGIGWGRAGFGRKGRPHSWQEAALREEGGDCGGGRGWWEPDVAERLPPTVRQRAPEPSARDTASIRFTFLTALQNTLPAYGSSPLSSCKHPTHRLLILFRHRLTAEAARQGVPFGHLRPEIPGRGEVGTGLENWRMAVGGCPAGKLGSVLR